MKHNYFTRLAALALTLILALSLTACGGKDTNTDGDNSGDTKTTVKIGVPNDTTNEARPAAAAGERHHQAGRWRRHHRHQERHRGQPLQRGDRGG